jgi:Ca2+/Na+ antiporter
VIKSLRTLIQLNAREINLVSDQEQTSPRTRGHTLLTVLASFLLVVTGLTSGAVLGGLYVKLFVPRAAMGWDGIADALGGLMLGGLIGLVVSIVLASALTVKRRLQVSAVLLAVVVAVISWGVITHETKLEPEPMVREQTKG